MDRSNLFGFCFLRTLAGDTAFYIEYAVGIAAVVHSDECDVRTTDSVVAAVVSDVVEIGLLAVF